MGTVLDDQGITVDLPQGWEGRIMVRAAPPPGAPGLHAPGAPGRGPVVGGQGWPGEQTNPVVHLANFALPADRGDFGSGAVDIMGVSNLLMVLFEFNKESAGTPLFANTRPAAVAPGDFDKNTLQHAIPGQVGYQRFFTEARRAFSLYIVLGSQVDAPALAAMANQTLHATSIAPR